MTNNLDLTKAIDNEDICVELLKKEFKFKGNILDYNNGYYVLRDGTILQCQPHSAIDLFLIHNNYISNIDNKFYWEDGSHFMEYLDAVRVRNEVVKFNYPAYLTLPKEPMTSKQFNIIKDWLSKILLNIKTYLIIDTGKKAKQYYLLEDEKAIEDIKFYYRTGVFE